MFQRIAVIVGVALLVAAGIARTSDQAAETNQPADIIPHDKELENVPAAEEGQINNIVELTKKQMKARYQGKPPILRGVHPKDHGCVEAMFRVLDADKLPPQFRVGVFAKPGKEYKAWIRFSTSGVDVKGDDESAKSRGMAIQLQDVEGKQLVKNYGPATQDFLMLNHPVFPFANVEDYEAFVAGDNSIPKFFNDRIQLDSPLKDMTNRAQRSRAIFGRIGSPAVPNAFQNPPASPVDNTYYSAVPFLFGPDRVMKYSARPIAPSAWGPPAPNPDPTKKQPDYLRDALAKRLDKKNGKEVVFEFQVQVRTKAQIAGKIVSEIEDACTEWTDAFTTVAMITIAPQDFNTEARRKQCEDLFFTPWHAIAEHQPIGGINRLKLRVYDASSELRHKKPAGN